MNIIIQPGYRSNTTLKRILSGICDFSNRQLNIVSSADGIQNGEKATVVISIDNTWEEQICKNLSEKNIHPITVFPSEDASTLPYTCITSDFFLSAKNLTSLLIPHSKKGIAFAGLNTSSSSDGVKLNGFKSALSASEREFNPDYVFKSDNDILKCVENVIAKKDKFDTVICANDITAITLSANLENPFDYNITGFSGMLCTRYTNPKITTVGTDYYSIGRAVLEAYNAVCKSDFISKRIYYVKSELILGETTPNLKSESLYSTQISTVQNFEKLRIYDDEVFTELDKIEILLQHADETDIKILKMLMSGKKYEEISAELFLSVSPLKYRIGKMLKLTDLKYKNSLVNLLEKYNVFKPQKT